MLQREQIESLEILGYVYFRQGRAKEARIVFEGLAALAPENEVALGHLAALAVERGDGAEALRRLDAYVAEYPDRKHEPALALLRIRALRLNGREDEAEKMLTEYFAATPDG
ncbi:MAG: tetratricopeptide repeat protein [Desulfovibrio sp.]|nr:tetratricopeptide repeat protein [Desulfovibrio sp.]